jgi:thiamine transporter
MVTKKYLIQEVSFARKLTESALLVALATVLTLFAVSPLPFGGSTTIGSMIPIMLVSFKYPFGWSLTVALVYSLIQMITGFYAPPAANPVNYALMIMLDYIIAFGVLCLAGPIYKALRKAWSERIRLTAAAVTCVGLRFVCHFLSGIIIWSSYAPPDQPVWLYSLLYNGSYMLAEGLITGLAMFLIGEMLVSLLRRK